MSRIGIVAALHDEIAALLQAMGPDVAVHHVGLRDYYVGKIRGQACVLVLARIGKVAAAATTVTLIREFNVTAVIFTGLAGAVATTPRVGDVVVGTSLVQHDMDASPLFPRYEIPLLGRSRFDADNTLSTLLVDCARDYLRDDFCQDVNEDVCRQLGFDAPAVHTGLIVSGDQFINDPQSVHALRVSFGDALCVEMEGAAVAQICFEYGVPFAILRIISDRADDEAGVDFPVFLSKVARFYSEGILQRFLERLATPRADGAVDTGGAVHPTA